MQEDHYGSKVISEKRPMKNITCKRNCTAENSRGSIAVETLLFLIPFVFCFCAIISMARFTEVQMIVHHALVQTAEEISTYGYVATRAGITQRMQNTNKQKGEFEGDVTEVVDTFSDFVTSFSEAGSTGNYQKVLTSGKAAYDSVSTYVDDPSAIAAGVFSWIKGEAREECVKFLASALARASITKHIDTTGKSTDAYLKYLGVVNGINGFDFSKSQFVSNTEGRGNIDIVVTFRMKPNLFPALKVGEKEYILTASTLMW